MIKKLLIAGLLASCLITMSFSSAIAGRISQWAYQGGDYSCCPLMKHNLPNNPGVTIRKVIHELGHPNILEVDALITIQGSGGVNAESQESTLTGSASLVINRTCTNKGGQSDTSNGIHIKSTTAGEVDLGDLSENGTTIVPLDWDLTPDDTEATCPNGNWTLTSFELAGLEVNLVWTITKEGKKGARTTVKDEVQHTCTAETAVDIVNGFQEITIDCVVDAG